MSAMALALVLAGCGGASEDSGSGTVPPPRRVVVMAPAAAEMMAALGAADRIVGVGEYVDEPPTVRGLPRVGAYDSPNLEAVLALETDLFVTSAFARQIAQAEAGEIPPKILVGNLEAIRDFTDVEDIVRAYRIAGSATLKHHTYNLCSSRGVKIQEILDLLLEQSTLKIEVEQDPARLRPSDMPLLIGDNRRFAAETGWQPEIPLVQTLGDLLEWWRQNV